MSDGDIIEAEAEIIEETDIVPAAEQYVGAEVDKQISTARKYPRSIAAFKRMAASQITSSAELAERCYYCLPPRDGKRIMGPSVRLAEIVASSYGNARFSTRIVDVGDTHLTAEGMGWDLERNLAVSVTVRRRITNKSGRRYSNDMITMTANAAASIAYRQAVFKIVPQAYTQSLYELAIKTAGGDEATLPERRAKMLKHFETLGVPKAKVFEMVDARGADDIDLERLVALGGIANAIADGDLKVSTITGEKEEANAVGEVIERLTKKKDGGA